MVVVTSSNPANVEGHCVVKATGEPVVLVESALAHCLDSSLPSQFLHAAFVLPPPKLDLPLSVL